MLLGLRVPATVAKNAHFKISVYILIYIYPRKPSYLFEWQQHELLGLGHLHKVLQDIFVSRLEQVTAGVRIGEPSDAQAVGGVQLTE